MRILFFTGKGGVGKTSVAAATACRLAEQGRKVLVMSTDQAHSLGDAFGVKLTEDPLQVREHLDALEINVVSESEKAWGRLQGYLKRLLASHAQGGLEAEELLVFPGLEELFSLFKILDFYEADSQCALQTSYEVLVIDCAPTGETLSMLKLPERFGGILRTVLPLKQKAVHMAGPAMERITKIPMPREDVFEELTRLVEKLERLEQLMNNRLAVSLRIVATPEKIVMREAEHLLDCLCSQGYRVDALILNRIYPPQALEGYFQAWIARQEENLREWTERSRGIPVLTLELQDHELQGVDALSSAAKLLYGEMDPAAL